MTAPDEPSDPAAPPSASDGLERNAALVGGLTLSSRVLGFVRDYLLIVLFSRARWVSDAFLAAFTVPNLFRNLLGEGALAASFLPVFVGENEKEGRPSAVRLAGQACGGLAVIGGALALLVALGALALDAFLRPDAPASLTLRLTAAMMPFMPLVCLAALLSSMLQGLRKFALPAALSIVLNLCFLAAFAWIYWGLLDGDPARLDAPFDVFRDQSPEAFRDHAAHRAVWILVGAVWGAGLLQVVLAWGRLRTLGYAVRASWRRDHPALVRVLRAFVPAAIGLGVVQLNVLVDMILSYYVLSREAEGAKSYLFIGNQLMHLPLAVFGTAAASTAFPYFARLAAKNDVPALVDRLGDTLRWVLLWTLPAGIGLAVIADPLVRMLYQWPDLSFSHVDAYRAIQTTTFYALGLPFFACSMLLVRALYARGDYRGPVRVAASMVGVNLVLNLVLMRAPDFLRFWRPGLNPDGFLTPRDLPFWRGGYAEAYGLANVDFPFDGRMGEAGLALATTLTALLQTGLLWWLARRHFRPADSSKIPGSAWHRQTRAVFNTAWRTLIAAAGMGVLTHWFVNSVPWEPEGGMRVLRFAVPMVLGVVAYGGMGTIVPVPEIEAVAKRLFKRRSPRGGADENDTGSAGHGGA